MTKLAQNACAGCYFYTPQDSVFHDTTLTRSPGDNLDFSLDFDENIPTNVYRWHKNGTFQFQITGNNDLEINNLQLAHAGDWTVEVTNPGAPDLTLFSRKITLKIQSAACLVTTTANAGPNSLREAILCANTNPGPDTIRFNIPGAGPLVITPLTPLPLIDTDSVVLDGSTQPSGLVVLDGSAAAIPVAEGLLWVADNSGFEMYDLVLRNATAPGLRLVECRNFKIGAPGKGITAYSNCRNYTGGDGTNAIVWNCQNGLIQASRFGITESNTKPAENPEFAITVSGRQIRVGGMRSLDEGNFIGNGTRFGIGLWGNTITPIVSHFNEIYGNNIGTGVAGTENFGGTGAGINLSATGGAVQIGDSHPDQFNIIRNYDSGIYTEDASSIANAMTNHISCNSFAGIDFGQGAVVPAVPVFSVKNNQISGTALPDGRIDVYRHDDSACPGAPCQGAVYLGSAASDAAGAWSFSGSFSANEQYTVTATGVDGRTSAFSPCQTVVASTGICWVKNTNDSGPESLREAILCANTNPGPDTIKFQIPGSGPHVIAPLTNLPDIIGDLTVLDATTQPGWSLGKIVLDGSNLTLVSEPILRAYSLTLDTLAPIRGFEIYGVVFRNAPGNALNLTIARDFKVGAAGKGNVFYETGRLTSTATTGLQIWRCMKGTVRGNFFGVDQNLAPAVRRSGVGVGVWADSVLIAENTISTPANGIMTLWYGPAGGGYHNTHHIQIFKNDISKCDNGVLVNNHSTDVQIGSDLAADENVFTENLAGVFIDNFDNRATVGRNAFSCNPSAGIEYKFASEAPTLPVIQIASTSVVSGTAPAGASVRVFRHGDPACPAAPCQGKIFLGKTDADASGNWSLAASVSAGEKVTATATSGGKTSEFSACKTVSLNNISVCWVKNTNDSGPESLREAINCANANPGPDTIKFQIPGAGPHLINLATPLPQITDDSLVLDATTQPGWSPGNITLDGSTMSGTSAAMQAANPAGFSGFEMYGLTMRSCPGTALGLFQVQNFKIGAPGKGNVFYGNAAQVTPNPVQVVLQEVENGLVQSNVIGVREDFTVPPVSNNVTGLGGEMRHVRIGGNRSAGEGNVIGNCFYGINLWDSPGGFWSDSIRIFGNDIGIAPNGAAIGNADHGISEGIPSSGSRVFIGDGSAQHANRIAHNGAGVFMVIAAAAHVSHNEFTCNAIGINNAYGPAAPVIASANPQKISGTAPFNTRVEVFAHQSCGNVKCQGAVWLGSTTADNAGVWSLAAPFAAAIAPGDTLVATATGLRTSEFSCPGFMVGGCSTLVTTVADSGPGSLREAINCVNTNPGPDTIKFQIPGAGPHLINLATPLPQITDDSLILDATTQPSWSLGKIVLDGSTMSGTSAALQAANPAGFSGFEMYGLTMRSCPGTALGLNQVRNVRIGAPGKGNVFYGNAISGLPFDGQVSFQFVENALFQSNIVGVSEDFSVPVVTNGTAGFSGIVRNLIIGGSRNLGEGNVFGNCLYGIHLWDLGSLHPFQTGEVSIFGNDIGIAPNGNAINCVNGINDRILSPNAKILVGDGAAQHLNSIANCEAGIWVWSAAIDIFRNEFACNSIGIDVINGHAPPKFLSATTQQISGTAPFNSRVEVFIHHPCGNAKCQGASWLGSTMADGAGNWTLLAPFAVSVELNDSLTATSTLSQTSQFSCPGFLVPPPLDCQSITVPGTPDAPSWICDPMGFCSELRPEFPRNPWTFSAGISTCSLSIELAHLFEVAFRQPSVEISLKPDSCLNQQGIQGLLFDTDSTLIVCDRGVPSPQTTSTPHEIILKAQNLTPEKPYWLVVDGFAGDQCKYQVSLVQDSFFTTRKTNLSQTICAGESVNFCGIDRSQTGIFTCNLTSVGGCDSVVTLNLTVKNALPPTPLAAAICPGDAYFFDGKNISTAGIYRDTLTAANGCDSVVVLTLTLKNQPQPKNLAASICPGDAYFFDGKNISTAGTYRDTLTAANGCDSVVVLTLTLKNQPQPKNLAAAICPGDAYFFDGKNISTAGTYRDTLTAANGCDSVVVLTLTLKNQPQPKNLAASICPGDAYFFDGKNISTAGTYRDTLTAANGCDSVLVLTLTLKNQPPPKNLAAAICPGDAYFFDGKNISTVGIYRDTLTAANGCDSVVILDLKIEDKIPPTIACPPGLTLQALAGQTSATAPPTAPASLTDNCPTPPTWAGQIGGQNFPVGTTAVTYTATDATGNSTTCIFNVVVLADCAVSLALAGDAAVCSGASASISATPTGCTGCHFSWSDAPGLDAATRSVNPSATTTYTVTATDSNGCTASASRTVEVWPRPQALLSGGGVICPGGSAMLRCTFGSGTPPWTISGKANGQVFSINDIAVSPHEWSVTPGATTTYLLENVSDTHGCTGSVSGSAAVEIQFSSAVTTLDTAVCPGLCVRVGGKDFCQPGVFTEKIKTAAGCDSTVVLVLEHLALPEAEARPDAAELAPGTTELRIPVLENDQLEAGFVWRPVVVSAPASGTADTLAGAVFFKLTAADFSGEDSLWYRVCAELCPAACDSALVRIFIQNDDLEEIERQFEGVLTPNDDGFGERFDPVAVLEKNDLHVRDASLTIFNRWGERIFGETSAAPVWTGRTGGGKPVPQSVYYYVLEAEVGAGKPLVFLGTVTVLE